MSALFSCKHYKIKPLIKMTWPRSFQILKCENCGLIFNLLPNLLTPEKIYSDTDSQKHQQEYDKYIKPSRLLQYQRALNKLEAHRKLNRILDVGCGYGYFLEKAKEKSWETYGLELSAYKVKYCSQELKLNVKLTTLEKANLPDNYFDVITLWDVIEHIPNPAQLLKECNRILKKSGVILIRTPNGEALTKKINLFLKPLATLYIYLVYPLVPKEHFYYFTPSQLGLLLKETGFTPTDIYTKESLGERMVRGWNIFLNPIRQILSYIGWRLNFPFEIVMIATKL